MNNPISAKLVTSIPPSINGRCYIGDPYYVFQSKDWDKHNLWRNFCEAFHIAQESPNVGSPTKSSRGNLVLMEFNWTEFLVMSTAYGDGEYPVRVGASLVGTFGVDSGTFSVIPISCLEKWGEEALARAARLGLIVEVSGTDCAIAEGNLRIGKVSIETSSIEEDDDCYDDNEEE